MPKTVYIRNLPDHVHSILKSRAAREGMSLSDFLERELERIAAEADFSDVVGRWVPDTAFDEIISAQREIDLNK